MTPTDTTRIASRRSAASSPGWNDAFSSSPSAKPHATILIVCTGNICRSPYVERTLAAHLESLDPSQYRVHSAGTRAVVGSDAHPETKRLLTTRDVDSSGFVARQLTERLAASADVVLTMERSHSRRVVQLAPSKVNRVFTLLEFASALDALAAGSDAFEDITSLVRAASRTRNGSGVPAQQVPDPIGKDSAYFDQLGAALDPIVQRVASRLIFRSTHV